MVSALFECNFFGLLLVSLELTTACHRVHVPSYYMACIPLPLQPRNFMLKFIEKELLDGGGKLRDFPCVLKIDTILNCENSSPEPFMHLQPSLCYIVPSISVLALNRYGFPKP